MAMPPQSEQTKQNKALVRRLCEAINRNMPALIDELCAADYTVHPVEHTLHTRIAGIGRDPIKQAIAAWHNALPDVYVSVDEMTAEGDRVTARWTLTGTHHGRLHGAPPSGRTIVYSGFSTLRIAGGRLAEEWTLYDRAGLWEQLGLMPESDEALVTTGKDAPGTPR
jgi:steroid delta-isomerase-like uncharacterized protein